MTSKYVCMCEYVTVCFPLRNWHVKTVQMICRGHGFENLCLCEKFLFFFLISLPSTTARRYHHHCHDHHGPPLLLRRERVAKFQIFLDLSLCAMRPVVSECVCKRKFHVGGAACCSSRNNQRTFRWPTVYKSNPRTCLKKNTKKKLQFGIFVKKEYNLLETFNSNQLDLFISILLLFNYT